MVCHPHAPRVWGADRDTADRHFEQLAELAERVALRRLVVRRSLDGLDQVLELIRHDVGALARCPNHPENPAHRD